MRVHTKAPWLGIILFLTGLAGFADQPPALPGTQPLTLQGDLSTQMVSGIDKFLLRELERSAGERQKLWKRDFSSVEAFEKSILPNRERLRKMIGAGDVRVPVTALELVSSTNNSAPVAETESFTVQAVRWPVLEGVSGEGLWLRPKGKTIARIMAIPDADQTPEMLAGLAPGLAPERQFARRLAENGCEVVVPVLIDRQDTWSGNTATNRFTNQPHREWIYRQAFEVGRHVIGYEVQKVLAVMDYWEAQPRTVLGFSPEATATAAVRSPSPQPSPRGEGESAAAVRSPSPQPSPQGEGEPAAGAQRPKVGVAGYGEGGLIALYAAALDPRISAALVSGYFDSRQRIWEEPIYRNVFGLLEEFGDAEIASLIAPRSLIVEYSPVPKVDGPPKPSAGRTGAAPGRLKTPDYESVEAEFERGRALLKGGDPKDFDRCKLIAGNEGMATGPASDRALAALLKALGSKTDSVKGPGKATAEWRANPDSAERQHRQIKELEDYTQKLARE
jgi:hypothetical protein